MLGSGMESLIDFGLYALSFVVLITVLVFVHEMGHYGIARWAGVRVEVFSIGFGSEITGWTDRHGTRWKISWVPLGGYVKFFGDAGAASQADVDQLDRLSEQERAVSFHHKSLGRRAAIVAAGPIANFIYALVVLSILFLLFGQRFTPPEIGRIVPGSVAEAVGFKTGDVVVAVDGDRIRRFEELDQEIFINPGRPLEFLVRRGEQEFTLTATPRVVDGGELRSLAKQYGDLGLRPFELAKVGRVQDGSPAAAAGFLAGDLIRSVNGDPVANFRQLQSIVADSQGRPLNVAVERGGESLTLTVSARRTDITDDKGEVHTRWLIGIVGAPREPIRLGLLDSISESVRVSYTMVEQTLEYLGQMIVGDRGTEDLGGPLRIAQASGQAAQLGIEQFVFLSVIISLNLGLINLFPIPLLDGGHLVMYALEGLRGRPLTERMQEYAFRFGLAMVVTFTVFVTWNDLANFGLFDLLTRLFS